MKKKDLIATMSDMPDNTEVEVFIRTSKTLRLLRRKPLRVRIGHEPMRKPIIVIEVNKSAK